MVSMIISYTHCMRETVVNSNILAEQHPVHPRRFSFAVILTISSYCKGIAELQQEEVVDEELMRCVTVSSNVLMR